MGIVSADILREVCERLLVIFLFHLLVHAEPVVAVGAVFVIAAELYV